ncbi:class C sortase [Robinsoniella peoriensis]|uniref:Sortase n=1 Tax=Robinsoniella peoriensis TaxID=180332 RepID=A0A4U8Q5T5_9FIRM|nr:class C sortase [Robinsoniella peoriensis]MDU7026857.1 class C sortase [Clostridiales bacterium]TLC99402.1 sortase [Robinsoniella peoriensis]
MEKIKNKVVFLVFLAGALILAYPGISNALAEQEQTNVISNYEETVSGLSDMDLAAEWKKAEAYNQSITGEVLEDPFVPGSGSALPDNYKEVLNVEKESGVMGYLKIPSIDVYLPVYHGLGESVLEKGVGHMENTALPIGGMGTHAVVAAHRGLSSAKLFTDLDKIKKKDIFYVYILNHVLTYQVDQISIIEPEDSEALRPVPDKEYVTLLTCTPYGINSHRLLVRGLKVDDQVITKEKRVEEEKAVKKVELTKGIAFAGVLFAAIAVIVVISIKKRKK